MGVKLHTLVEFGHLQTVPSIGGLYNIYICTISIQIFIASVLKMTGIHSWNKLHSNLQSGEEIERPDGSWMQ